MWPLQFLAQSWPPTEEEPSSVSEGHCHTNKAIAIHLSELSGCSTNDMEAECWKAWGTIVGGR